MTYKKAVFIHFFIYYSKKSQKINNNYNLTVCEWDFNQP